MKCQPIGEQWAGQDLPVSSMLQLQIILYPGLFVFQKKILFWSLKWRLYWLYKYNFWNIFILMHLFIFIFGGDGRGGIRGNTNQMTAALQNKLSIDRSVIHVAQFLQYELCWIKDVVDRLTAQTLKTKFYFCDPNVNHTKFPQ